MCLPPLVSLVFFSCFPFSSPQSRKELLPLFAQEPYFKYPPIPKGKGRKSIALIDRRLFSLLLHKPSHVYMCVCKRRRSSRMSQLFV